jgi:hypothetical protein
MPCKQFKSKPVKGIQFPASNYKRGVCHGGFMKQSTTATLPQKFITLLLGAVCFLLVGSACVTSSRAAEDNTSNPQQVEIVYWQSIKDSKDPQLYKAYLNSYPEGAFAPLAKLLYDKYSIHENSADAPVSDYHVALFHWELQEDAGYLRSIIRNETSKAVARWPGMVFSASYYKDDVGHTVAWLGEDGVYLDQKENIWQDLAPHIETIVKLGKELDIDAILIGKMRAHNKWSDQYNMKYLKIWMIDTRTGKTIYESATETMTAPREALIKMIDQTVARFWKEFVSKEPS